MPFPLLTAGSHRRAQQGRRHGRRHGWRHGQDTTAGAVLHRPRRLGVLMLAAGALALSGAAPAAALTASSAAASAIDGSGAVDTGCSTEVGPEGDLAGAVAGLGAGVTVCLTPGTYHLSQRLVLSEAQSGTAEAPAVLRARDGLGSVLIDAGGAEEAVYIPGAQHVVVSGLRLTGGAYHAVKVDFPSTDVLISDNEMFDNDRAGDPDGQYSAVKGCCFVSHVTIERNDIYNTVRLPYPNVQGIDCNGCKSWVVRGNRIHGILGFEDGLGVQFKSGSADTVIEDNLMYGNFIGISYGGDGNPQEWGGEQYEHVRGVVRNNVLYDNEDAAITAIETQDGLVRNNTMFNNGFTPDVRVSAANLRYERNVLDRRLNLRYEGQPMEVTETDNHVLSSPDDGSIFADAGARDLRVVAPELAGIGAQLP